MSEAQEAQIKILQKRLVKLKKQALKVYGEWENKKSKTQKSKRYVKSIATGAERFNRQLESLNIDRNTFQVKYQEIIREQLAIYAAPLNRAYGRMLKGYKLVKSAGNDAHTLDYRIFLDPFRGFFATIRRIPEMEEEYGGYVESWISRVGHWDKPGKLKLRGRALVAACKDAKNEAKEAKAAYERLLQE